MLCPSRAEFKLFLARGVPCSELTPTECGMVSTAGVTTTDELVEAACLLRVTGLVGGVKCFICHRPGHKSYDCPHKPKKPSEPGKGGKSRSAHCQECELG